jgi:tRNA threonylcarbamoyl adenosine modification protein (Sua5/YciO/YrdC/YwlC family)
MKVKELPESIYTSVRLRFASLKNLVEGKKKLPVIVSLTSIPERLNVVDITIKSLFAQKSVIPEKVILSLHKSLKDKLPNNLKKLQGPHFEIHYSELTCSHRKLIHSLERFPNNIIITCDDDVIYRNEFLNKIYQEHLRFPEDIIANSVAEVKFDNNGNYKPYNTWSKVDKKEGFFVVPIGVNGVLYPPNSLYKEVFNIDLFLELTPKADDLWFKGMALLQGTKSRLSSDKTKKAIPIIGTQKVALKKENMSQSKNDSQWLALSNYFQLDKILKMRTEIDKSLAILEKGETLLYPTDTVWGLGCDATNESAVKKIYTIKNREESKSLIVLVNSIEMLQSYVAVPEKAIQLLKESKKPTTIIYSNPKGIATNIINKSDNTLAIRIVKNDFCEQLITEFGKPIVSTSANVSGNPTPKSFNQIEKPILDSVDYIVNLQRDKVSEKSSTILKIDGEEISVIRE